MIKNNLYLELLFKDIVYILDFTITLISINKLKKRDIFKACL